MIRAIIVDDEPNTRDTLHNLLKKFCPQVNIEGVADSVKSGLALIGKIQPELVFLDIEMPHADGFQLIEQGIGNDFEVIFTTAYDQYAVKAFRYNALDYLLKPIDIDSLQVAVGKAFNKISEKRKLDNPELQKSNAKIALPTKDGFELLSVDQILRGQSEGNYTKLVLTDSRIFIISKPLKEIEDILSHYNFFRIHKSHLVNMEHVSKYLKGKGGMVVLEDGTELEVSVRKKEEFLKRLNTI